MKNKLIKLISLVALTLPMLFATSMNVYSMEADPYEGHPASIADGTDHISALPVEMQIYILDLLSDDLNSVKRLSAVSRNFRGLIAELKGNYKDFISKFAAVGKTKVLDSFIYEDALQEYKRLCDIRKKIGHTFFKEKYFRLLNDEILLFLGRNIMRCPTSLIDIENEFIVPLSNGIELHKLSSTNGVSLLMKAIVHGHAEIAKILLRFGSDVNKANEDGLTALMCASEKDFKDIVTILLQTANVNQKTRWGETALIMAIMKGHIEIVEELLKAGADLAPRINIKICRLDIIIYSNLRAFDGLNALEIAEKEGHHEIAEMIWAEEVRRAERKRAAGGGDLSDRPEKRAR